MELVLVSKPQWWKPHEHVPGQERYWVLQKCLPGQRNAAARFYDFFTKHLESLDFETTALLPSLFRHKSKDLVVCSHVDDLVLAGDRRELEWLISELEKKYVS